MSETPNYPIPYLVLEEWYFPDGTDYPERFSIRLREWDTLGAEEKGFHDEECAEACIRSPHHLQQTEGFYKEKDDRGVQLLQSWVKTLEKEDVACIEHVLNHVVDMAYYRGQKTTKDRCLSRVDGLISNFLSEEGYSRERE